MSLLVCGGIFVEEITGRAPRIGGSGFTAAIAAARYGAEVSLAGWVGADKADETFALLDGAGVDRVGVLVLDGETTRYRIGDPADVMTPMPSVTIGVTPDRAAPALPSSSVVLCFGTPGFDVVRTGWLDRAAEGAVLLFDRQGSQSMVLGATMATTVPATRRILLGNVYEMVTETKASGMTRVVEALPAAGFDLALVKTGAWGVLGVGPACGDARGFGAFDVPIRSTIGSGDVFAGIVSALMAQGRDVLDAVPEAVAAAGAWIACSADAPPANLRQRAAEVVAGGPAIWVDRRKLEGQRFEPRLDNDMPTATRQRVARALRYLGMETLARAGEPVVALDLRGLQTGDAAEAIARAVTWARSTVGEQT